MIGIVLVRDVAPSRIKVGPAGPPTSAPAAGAAVGCAGKAYVTNNGDGTVSVITTATGAVSAPITVGNSPIGGGDHS